MIEAKSEKFWGLVARDAKLTRTATGFGFTEGPVFSRRGYLLFSDMKNQRIMKWERGSLTTYREQSNTSNGLTFDHQGRLLACEKGRVTRTEKNGAITVLADKDLQGPNDLVYCIDGSVYFTDLPRSRVYQITRKGDLRVVAEDCQGPNGVALSPNQQQLYVADYRGNKVRRYDIAPDGSLRNGKDFAAIKGDGLKTDEMGNVWISGPTAIEVFDRDGQPLGTIETPEAPTNLNWGEGFHGIYITARTSVYHLAGKAPGTRTY